LDVRDFRGVVEGGITLPADHRLTRAHSRGRPDVVIAAVLLALCAGVLAGFSWSRPTREQATLLYTQSGRLSYGARTGVGSVYGRAGLTTGEPVYAADVNQVAVSYAYVLNAVDPTAISGTEQLVATMTNGNSLSQTIALQQKSSFTGEHFDATGTLNLKALQTAANAFERASGEIGSQSFTVSIAPRVEVHGRIDNAPLVATFNQPVSFAYTSGSPSTPASLVPVSSNQGTVAGSTSAATSGIPSAFSATTTGRVAVAGGRASTLVPGLSVEKARLISLAVLAVALLIALVLGRRLLGDAISKDERVRIATRYGESLVEVDDLPSAPGLVVVELSSFDGLREVARRLECPVLHRVAGEGSAGDVYAVIESGTLYRYGTNRRGARAGKTDDSNGRGKAATPAHKRRELAHAGTPIGHGSTPGAAAVASVSLNGERSAS
jgi:hypothetical protein